MDASDVNVPFLWNRLCESLHHLSQYDRRRVMIGLILAYDAHDGQFRKSGEPFITHPVEVARILGSHMLDADTIISALLHDTVEDTNYISFDEIEGRFGKVVRKIVESVTRLTKLGPTTPGESLKDVDRRHFFMSMSQDVRILLVKLADRLHNMRTMESMKSEKQKEKASETLRIYAPLAGLLGLESLKEELEDLSLRYLDSERFFQLRDYLRKTESTYFPAIREAEIRLQERLDQDPVLRSRGVEVTVTRRQKSIYSLYKSYENSGWRLEGSQGNRPGTQLHVLLDLPDGSTALCYYVLGAIHLMWSPIPNKLKDCIATPSPMSWKGLMTTVWPTCAERLVTPIEVLIQTADMCCSLYQNIAPLIRQEGDSSHDESDSLFGSLDDSEYQAVRDVTMKNRVNGGNGRNGDYRWIGFEQWADLFQKWQTEVGTTMSSRDYVDCIQTDLLSPSVYVLTPAREIVQLPKGSTVLDFAYHIHTDIGNRAIGARVDGSSVGPAYVLRNAQVVEIQTADLSSTPEYLQILKSRLKLVRTTSAKKKLKNFLKTHSKLLEEDDSSETAFSRTGSRFWVELLCKDRLGILAEVTSILHSHQLNITRHWGDTQDDSKCHVIKVHLHDPCGSKAQLLFSKLASIDGCERVAMGCTLPNPAVDPRGWWHLPATS